MQGAAVGWAGEQPSGTAMNLLQNVCLAAVASLAWAGAATAGDLKEPCKNHYILDDCPSPVPKSPNSFRFSKVYSSPAGHEQFIQMVEMAGNDGQHHLGGLTLVATDHRGNVRRMTIPHDLPSDRTAFRSFIFSTHVQQDFAIPDGFVPTDGGTLELVGVDRWEIGPLPQDGIGSLARFGPLPFANQPTHFQMFGGGRWFPVTATESLVEYRHAATGGYFLTMLAAEIEALDSGREPGWARTGAVIEVSINRYFDYYDWYDEMYLPASMILHPVCRLYVPPPVGPTHLYSPSADECSRVVQDLPGAILETSQAFLATPPVSESGECQRELLPVYRLWNGASIGANHRFTAHKPLRDAMVAQGWISEGYGPAGVTMCAKGYLREGDTQ
jgi:hypothetical protein